MNTVPRARSARFRPLILLFCLPGCHTRKPIDLAPGREFGATTRVYVQRMDSSSVVLLGPRVVADSLVGIGAGSTTRVAVALADVRRAQQDQVSGTRTTLAVLGIAAGVLVVVGLMLGFVAYGLGSAMSAEPQY